MSERSLILCTHETVRDPVIVDREVIEFVSQANQLQIANDMAERNNVKYGHVAVLENGLCIDKLTIGAY